MHSEVCDGDRGLFFAKARGGVHMTGFSDGVRLGGHGVIKNDETVVMRVEVEENVGQWAVYEWKPGPA